MLRLHVIRRATGNSIRMDLNFRKGVGKTKSRHGGVGVEVVMRGVTSAEDELDSRRG